MELLQGKKAIITGGSSGIGKAICKRFFQNGADIIFFARDKERSQKTLEELEKLKVNPEQKAEYVLVDVSDTKAVESALNTIYEKWQQLDILINNAGITKDALLMKMSEEQFDDVIRINLKSVYNTCKAVCRWMIRQKFGKIINISSVVGLIGNMGQTNYAASKAGVIGFTKSLAKELARKNVCVNCIAPGYIQTPMTKSLPDKAKEELLEKIPMRKLGEPEDIANVALFLSSYLSEYMTGQVITVDGGMVI